MTKPRLFPRVATGLLLGALSWSVPAGAQAPAVKAAPAPVPAPAPSSTSANQDRFAPAPVVRVPDASVHSWAPVNPPYSNSAYHDLGGQPETSQDVISAQHPRR